MKNKTTSILAILLTGVIILLFGYLIYQVVAIWGLWTLFWTFIVSMFSSAAFMLLASSKAILEDKIIFNPKEWPKLLSLLISGLIGYYLYSSLDRSILNDMQYYFAIAYLALLTFIPIIYNLYKLIRDRNDEVVITTFAISYKDNSRTGSVNISDIDKSESGSDGYALILKDGSRFTIPFKEMGFSSLDTGRVIAEIEIVLKHDVTEVKSES